LYNPNPNTPPQRVVAKLLPYTNQEKELLQKITEYCEALRYIKDHQTHSGCENIVKYIDSYRIGLHQAVILMQFYTHGNLASLIDRDECQHRWVHTIAEDIRRGLQFIHTHFLVVHNDINPENILIEMNADETPRAVIGDFGL
jgi:serine/threonine protein kinase